MRYTARRTFNAVAASIFIVAVLLVFPAWVTHCATLLARLFEGDGPALWNAILLVVGALLPPIGVVHGWLIWFGVA